MYFRVHKTGAYYSIGVNYYYKKSFIIKKKIKIAKEAIHSRLHREPLITHPRLKFIPNIVVNGISLLLTLAIVGVLLYFILDYLIMKFYHLD